MIGNLDIEEQLSTLPDRVAEALEQWRIASLDREKIEALLFASIKGQNTELSATEIKSRIHADLNRYESVLHEIKAESNYTRLYERLLSAKKRASLRTAF